MGRLASIQYSTATDTPHIKMAYDKVGNRTQRYYRCTNPTYSNTVSYSYNAANQISSGGHTYDNNGNLTSDGTNTYTWDRANRLLSMGGSSYKYEGGGHRIQQTVGATVSKYLLDLNSGLPTVLAETVGANATRFVYSLRGLHQLKTAGGMWEHTLTDALGSLRVVTNHALAVQESRSYGVYGDPVDFLGTVQTSYGYTGEPTDGNGLVYDRARYMSPALGQFVSLDPKETFNRYAYVNGNPVMRTDPDGMRFILDDPGESVLATKRKYVLPKSPTVVVPPPPPATVSNTNVGFGTGGGPGAPTPVPTPPKPTQNTQNVVAPGFGSGSGATVSKPAIVPDGCHIYQNDPKAYADCRRSTTYNNNPCPPNWRREVNACYPNYEYDYGNSKHNGNPYPADVAWQIYWGQTTRAEGAQIAFENGGSRTAQHDEAVSTALLGLGGVALLALPGGQGLGWAMLQSALVGAAAYVGSTLAINALQGKEPTDGLTFGGLTVGYVGGALTGGTNQLINNSIKFMLVSSVATYNIPLIGRAIQVTDAAVAGGTARFVTNSLIYTAVNTPGSANSKSGLCPGSVMISGGANALSLPTASVENIMWNTFWSLIGSVGDKSLCK